MKSHKIDLPKSLTSKSAVAFAQEMINSPKAENYVFDFNNMQWVEPFGMLFVAEALRQFMLDRKAKYSAVNYQKHEYYAHMGFFQSFGLDFGKRPGEDSGSANYIPITDLQISDLYREAHDRGEAIGDVITTHSHEISKILTRTNSGNLFDSVQYAIREILRNSVEHSKSRTVRYCGQY